MSASNLCTLAAQKLFIQRPSDTFYNKLDFFAVNIIFSFGTRKLVIFFEQNFSIASFFNFFPLTMAIYIRSRKDIQKHSLGR